MTNTIHDTPLRHKVMAIFKLNYLKTLNKTAAIFVVVLLLAIVDDASITHYPYPRKHLHHIPTYLNKFMSSIQNKQSFSKYFSSYL
jgi:hypothetical protein